MRCADSRRAAADARRRGPPAAARPCDGSGGRRPGSRGPPAARCRRRAARARRSARITAKPPSTSRARPRRGARRARRAPGVRARGDASCGRRRKSSHLRITIRSGDSYSHGPDAAPNPAMAPVRSRSTSSARWTWPVAAVRGRASTSSSRRGCLNPARRPAQWLCSASSVGCAPAARDDHRAHDLAPGRVGQPDDRDLGDRGWSASTASTSAGATRLAAGADHVAHAPDDRAGSPRRRASRDRRVWYQPSRSAARLSLGLLEVAVHEELAAHAHLAALAESQVDARLTARPTLPGLRSTSTSASERARAGLGRAVVDARRRCAGSASLMRAHELGRRRRRAGVGLAQARGRRTSRRRLRGCAPTPRGCT